MGGKTISRPAWIAHRPPIECLSATRDRLCGTEPAKTAYKKKNSNRSITNNKNDNEINWKITLEWRGRRSSIQVTQLVSQRGFKLISSWFLWCQSNPMPRCRCHIFNLVRVATMDRWSMPLSFRPACLPACLSSDSLLFCTPFPTGSINRPTTLDQLLARDLDSGSAIHFKCSKFWFACRWCSYSCCLSSLFRPTRFFPFFQSQLPFVGHLAKVFDGKWYVYLGKRLRNFKCWTNLLILSS